jgi:hypothetical protein
VPARVFRQRGASGAIRRGQKLARENCHVRLPALGGDADLTELTSMMVEALAEVILLAPESEQAKIMADALAHFGNMFLEKSGAVEGDPARAPH